MTSDILRKLQEQLEAGIGSEVQVVYLLAGIRKLIERDNRRDEFRTLNFHCDWALHSRLDRTYAQEVLNRFDEAHQLLSADMRLHELPPSIRSDIDDISQMRVFERELQMFLMAYNLPPIWAHRPDGWTYFLQFYTQVIEDIPLLVKARPDDARHLSQVTVKFERAKEIQEGERLFKVSWIIEDKNGKKGELFILNGYRESVPS